MGYGIRRYRAIPVALAAFLIIAAGSCFRPPGGGGSGTTTTTGTPPPPGSAPTFGAATTLVQGLQVPWSIVWPDRNTMIVTERPGRFRVVANGQLRPQPIGSVTVTTSGEGGLMGIALHPQWPAQRWLYAYYTAPSGNRLVRFPVAADLTLGAEQRLLPEIPEGVFHDGGYIAFGPDGMLYLASGDGTNPPSASDRTSLNGKILRVTPEGTVPADNPFPGSYVWSWGHRNPQGLAWDAQGRLYEAEHGPTTERPGLCCNDEFNLIQKGGYYGWPYFAGNTRTTILTGNPPATVIPPLATSGNSDTWAPSALALFDAADGTTHLYQAELRGAKVRHFTINKAQPSTIVRTDTEVTQFGRLRASVFGPDGCHYLTTSNRDSRGTPRTGDDRIIRRCPT
jgi:glucose/arabinose dehydrogenase